MLSYKHTFAQQGGAKVGHVGGLTGGRADISEFFITKILDKSSPNLAKFCVSAQVVPTVVIEVCAANKEQHTYMKYTLTDVVISSVASEGSNNDELLRPTEKVGFRFGKIAWEYTPWDNKGAKGAAVKAEWDVALHK